MDPPRTDALPSYFDGTPAQPAATNAPPPPPTAADMQYQRDQEQKILTQEVSQAFYHLVDAQKRFQGVEETSVAAQTADPAAATLTARGGAPPAGQPRNYRTRDNYMMRQSADGRDQGTGLGGFKLEFTSGYIAFIPELTALFLSCVLPVLAVSGRGVLATLLVGLLATYMFDYTNQRQLALLSVWCCIAMVWAGLYVTNLNALSMGWLNVFIILNCSLYLLMLGMFATIQFRWLQLQYPEVALATERCLLGLTPITLLPLVFSTLVSFVGSQVAPFVFAAVLCGLHRVFYTLRKSAFKEALVPEAKWEEYINGKVEAVLFCAATLALPVLSFVLTNHRERWFDVLHLLNAFTLIAIPAFYLFYKPEHTLWWMYGDAYGDRKSADVHWLVGLQRRAVLILAYSVVLHWLIYRVAFGRFAYLFSGVAPPFNVVLVAVAAYAGSVVLYFAVDLVENQERNIHRAAKWSAVLLFSMLGAAAITYVAGMPRFIICCSALSASCLTNFCLDPRNVNNYILFVCTTFILLIWWMYHSFSFLRMELPIFGGAEYISLPQLSVYILWLYLIQCMIFPLGIGRSDKAFFMSLLQQVCALAMVEHVLYSQEENFYPATCVIGTTCWGIYCAATLHHNKRVSQAQSSVVIGLYVAKLYLFGMVSTLPEAGTELFVRAYGQYSLVLTFVFMALIVTIAVQLYFERQDGKRRSSFATLTTLYLVGSVVVALLSRRSVVLALLELMTGDSEAQTGRMIGLVTLFAGLLQLPLTTVLPPSQTKPSKICHGFIVVGAVIALLDPFIEGTSEESGLDMDVYEPPAWAPWVGIASVVLVGVTLLNIVTLPDNTALRIVWWTTIAGGCGTAFTASFMPYPTWHSYALISLVFALVVLCIDFAHYSVSAQEESSNSVWGLYSGTLMALLACLMDAQWRVPDVFDHNLRLETATQRQNAVLCLTVGINLVLAALIKLKLTDRPALKPRNLSRMDTLRESQGDGSHFGLLGNICVIQAYLSLLMLKGDVGTTSPGFAVLISPLLLLMHDDGWLFTGLADADQLTRYVPPMVASLMSLSWRAMMLELPALINKSPGAFAVQLTVFLLAAAFGASAAYDMWIDAAERRREGTNDAYVIAVVVALFLLAATEAIRLLAGVTLIACVLPLFNDSAWARKLAAAL